MVIENPRDGSELRFVTEPELPALVEVINDGQDELLGLIDGVISAQFAYPGEASPELLPLALTVALLGPSDVLNDASLPLQLQLEDWLDTAVFSIDLFGDAFVFAEIHSLTAVVPEPSTVILLIAGSLCIRGRRLSRRLFLTAAPTSA
jgi:hypothetical protein